MSSTVDMVDGKTMVLKYRDKSVMDKDYERLKKAYAYEEVR